MAVTNPRNRLVNFRVSEEEFQNLRQASLLGGARSISEFARSAVLKLSGEAGELGGELQGRLSTIDQKMDVLDSSLRTLLGHLQPPEQQATPDYVEESLLSGKST